jgi:hypothetical protein
MRCGILDAASRLESLSTRTQNPGGDAGVFVTSLRGGAADEAIQFFSAVLDCFA